MKAALFIAAALTASANGAVIENRQGGRPQTTSRGGSSGGDGTEAPIQIRNPQDRPPWFSIGRPTASVTVFPNDPDADLAKCGLDAFVGHNAEASLFCSSILKGGTATSTATYTARDTTTVKTTVYTTLYPPSTTARPPTSRPPTSTPRPPTSTPKPSSTIPSSTPSPSPSASCGIVGYTKTTAAYYFDSSGTKNNWAACSAACKADTKCKSFGYGEANCMLFDVTAADNTNYNPMSPYTFYDQSCPSELPVFKKRQINISLGLPGGPPALSSACSCLITSGQPDATKTVTSTVTSVRVTRTETVTRTVSLLPDSP